MMNIRTQSRTFKKSATGNWRVYKFIDYDALNKFVDIVINGFFKKSISVISKGIVHASEIDFLRNMSDDNAWLELMIKCGDYILVTREDINQKVIDLENYEKFKYKIKNNLKYKIMEFNQESIKEQESTNNVKANTRWTQEELNIIWSGPVREVASILNRTPAAVTFQRVLYKQNHPDFVAPPESKNAPKQKKAVRKNKSTKTYAQIAIAKREQEEKKQEENRPAFLSESVSETVHQSFPVENNFLQTLKSEYNALNEKLKVIKSTIEIYGGKI